jgi:hypothetical protein
LFSDFTGTLIRFYEANMSFASSAAGLNFTPKPEDVLKILVATDIHLGYGEKNQFLGEFSN